MNELLPRKKKKRKLKDLEIEEEGMYPIHEEYTKEGTAKQ